MRTTLVIGAVGGGAFVGVRLARSRRSTVAAEASPAWPPLVVAGASVAGASVAGASVAGVVHTTIAPPADPEAEAEAEAPTEAVEPAPVPTPEPWVDPVDRACPASHPVKGKLGSRIFHLPGMLNYERTRADRCYLDPAAAELDGLRMAKR